MWKGLGLGSLVLGHSWSLVSTFGPYLKLAAIKSLVRRVMDNWTTEQYEGFFWKSINNLLKIFNYSKTVRLFAAFEYSLEPYEISVGFCSLILSPE